MKAGLPARAARLATSRDVYITFLTIFLFIQHSLLENLQGFNSI
jgi:hypothetical protein